MAARRRRELRRPGPPAHHDQPYACRDPPGRARRHRRTRPGVRRGGRLAATAPPSPPRSSGASAPTRRCPYRDAAEILSLARRCGPPGRGGRAHVVRPVAAAAVRRQGGARRPGAAGARRLLLPAGPDGSRGGVYFANTSDPASRLRHESEAIAFHEAVPGHHFQLADPGAVPLAVAQGLHSTAYAEGWGLYAERLADEMGLYSADVDRLGMLCADSLRASRLVVDTGMHALGWSRDQAVTTGANSPMTRGRPTRSTATSATPARRWPTWSGGWRSMRYAPGGAAHGDRFDIRGFHDAVLAAARCRSACSIGSSPRGATPSSWAYLGKKPCARFPVRRHEIHHHVSIMER